MKIERSFLVVLLLFVLTINCFAQEYTITGTVYDAESKETLVGCTILNKTTKRDGTISNIDGKFSLEISGKHLLQVSCIGYKSINFEANTANEYSIYLFEDNRKNKKNNSYIKGNTAYNKAAERMNFRSQYEKLDAKTIYETGDKYYKEKNYNKAVEYYQKAAEQNHTSAQNKLGYMYYYGYGVEKNYTKAVEWYRKAAEQGNKTAQNNLDQLKKNHPELFNTKTNLTASAIANNPTTTKPISTPPTTTTTAPSSNNKQKINTVAEKRIALIIGNGDYANGRLSNPTNDAQDITKKLKSLGFETMGRTNLGLRKMKDGITEFCEKAKGYDAAMFYYAGHAMQDKGINYLVPIGAQIKSNADIEYECIDMNWVLRSMEESGIKTKIIILDACRNNPVAQSWERSFTSSGLTAITSVPEGTFLVFATQAGKVAKDGVGQRNSPYTKALLKMLDVPMIPIHDMFHKVKQEVANQTNKKQIPQETNNLIGDFYFNTKQQ